MQNYLSPAFNTTENEAFPWYIDIFEFLDLSGLKKKPKIWTEIHITAG